jgi:hypothetical protein
MINYEISVVNTTLFLYLLPEMRGYEISVVKRTRFQACGLDGSPVTRSHSLQISIHALRLLSTGTNMLGD